MIEGIYIWHNGCLWCVDDKESLRLSVLRWNIKAKWALICDFQQCGILTCVDSDEPVKAPFKPRNSKSCLVRSLRGLEYSSDKQRLWSDCAYAQAGLSFCWSPIPHCWKSHVAAQIYVRSVFWLLLHFMMENVHIYHNDCLWCVYDNERVVLQIRPWC